MTDEQIQALINNLQEGLYVEVKNWLGGLAEERERARLAKEIIALANSGGGAIFIGFDDTAQGHPEIAPEQGHLEAFSQDRIAAVVARYVTPPCQCRVAYAQRLGSEIRHPVIIVPGDHRTPLWASRADPEQRILQTDRVYVRRPGGASEPSRTQDDWEKLIDRLVKARQDDLLTAMRKVINPLAETDQTPRPNLEEWDRESYAAWTAKIAQLAADSPHRLAEGHWTFSFSIEGFQAESLNALNEMLRQDMPAYSGWPPFTYLQAEGRRPVARGDLIEAWLANLADNNGETSDYWRISRDGKGFLLRPMQEDRADFMANRMPRPQPPLFDWILPIYRVTELLKFVEALALRFAGANSQISVILRYYSAVGRRLCCHSLRWNVLEGARCAEESISSSLTFPTEEIGINIEERVQALLVPIFEQFEFTELRKAIVDRVVQEVLGNRAR
ncbi:ATP-binding protein [Hyphomicrobium sp. B1]|uniref:AlbA family DNA-binding domain-containing protein n=1 Tax=unclassified Hyphomicrobium TaxID=2619925 RepID=UPI00391DFCBE